MRPARIYHDPDGADCRGTFSEKGITPSPVAVHAEHVIEEGFKRMSLPFDDRTHSSVRGVIVRLRLPPDRLVHLVSHLGLHASGLGVPSEKSNRTGDVGYREVAFYCYRAALSVLVETAPRSRQDLHDLLPMLMWPGALPPAQQAKVASVIGAHVADLITGRPFKRRALVARGGAR